MYSEKKGVLVVDDEAYMLRYIAGLISRFAPDFKVTAMATDGIAALKLATEAPPRLLITDIRMPVMDGLKLVEEVQARAPETVCVIMSAYSDYPLMRSALQLGVADYLLKPVEQASFLQLLERVSELLDTRGAGGAEEASPEPDGAQTSATPALDAILARIRAEPTRWNVTGQLARDFNLSESYLRSLFARHVGMSPVQYITRARIDAAISLMRRNPGMMQKEIAAQVGFTDALYFSRVFKRATGMPPSRFMEETGRDTQSDSAEDALGNAAATEPSRDADVDART